LLIFITFEQPSGNYFYGFFGRREQESGLLQELVQEGRGQKAEGRGQKAEGRRQKAEGRRQKAEGRRQKGKRQKAEGQKAEGQKACNFYFCLCG